MDGRGAYHSHINQSISKLNVGMTPIPFQPNPTNPLFSAEIFVSLYLSLRAEGSDELVMTPSSVHSPPFTAEQHPKLCVRYAELWIWNWIWMWMCRWCCTRV